MGVVCNLDEMKVLNIDRREIGKPINNIVEVEN